MDIEKKTEGLQMKGKKKYLTVSKEDVNKFIEYILIARNAYIDDEVFRRCPL